MFFKKKILKGNQHPSRKTEELLKTKHDLASKILLLFYYAGIRFKNDKIQIHWTAHIGAFCCIFNYIFQLMGIVQAREDTDKLLECFSIVTFFGMGILKLISLRNSSQLWYYLIKFISKIEKEQLVFKRLPSLEYESDDENLNGFQFSKHIEKYSNRYQALFNLLTKLYAMTDVIYTFAPFIEYVILKIRMTEPVPWPHIMPGWYPLDNTSLIGYTIFIFTELVSSFYIVYIHTIFDFTSAAICIFICGQFNLLREYSENIAGAGKNWSSSKARDERAHYRIIESHKMHMMLTDSTGKLREALRNILGVYFFIVTFTLCSVAVRVNAEVPILVVVYNEKEWLIFHCFYFQQVLSVVQMISWVQYMCGLLIQLFLFCYYGNNVFNQSSVGMGNGPFGAAYWCVSTEIKKELSILAIGMLKPQRLHAGPFVFVSLTSFIQIIRTAYSYYALIR